MDNLKLLCNSNYYKKISKLFVGESSHALLFYCSDSVLLSKLAILVANGILTGNYSASDDAVLKMILSGTHPDCLVYPKNKSFLTADSCDIIEKSIIKPMMSERKIFIINSIHDATMQSQNKLLKVLEEPPKNVFFIVLAKAIEGILPTILSRTVKCFLPPMSIEEMSKFLGIDKVALQNVYALSGGYPFEAQSLLNDPQIQLDYENVKDVLIKIKSSKDILPYSIMLSKDKDNFKNKLLLLEEFFRDMLVIRSNKGNLVKHISFSELKNIASEYSELALIKIIELINETNRKFDANVALPVLCDNLLLGILEVKYLCK